MLHWCFKVTIILKQKQMLKIKLFLRRRK